MTDDRRVIMFPGHLERPGEADLKGGGGSGTSGGMTDDWKNSVDRQLGQLHDDVRSLLRWGGAAVVLLVTLIGGLYLYFNARFDSVQRDLANVQIEARRVEGKIDTNDARSNGKLDLLIERNGAASSTVTTDGR